MTDKQIVVLDAIIDTYINNPLPVSSTQLQEVIDIKISSATIRNYFKKMVEGGCLIQEHISSGRIPSNKTLKKFWTDSIDISLPIEIKSIENLNKVALSVGLYCVLKKSKELYILNEVINIENKYLLLIFNDEKIVKDYQKPLEGFLKEFIGLELEEVLKISEQVGANSLNEKLTQFRYKEKVEKVALNNFVELTHSYEIDNIELESLLNGSFLDDKDHGIYFNDEICDDFIAFKHQVVYNCEKFELITFGKLKQNYKKFYNNI